MDLVERIVHIQRLSTALSLTPVSRNNITLSLLGVQFQASVPIAYDIGEQRGYGVIEQDNVYIMQYHFTNLNLGMAAPVFSVRDREVPKYRDARDQRVIQQVMQVHFLPLDEVVRDDMQIYENIIHKQTPAFVVALPTPLNELPDNESRTQVLEWALEEAIGALASSRINNILEWDTKPLLNNVQKYESDSLLHSDVPARIRKGVKGLMTGMDELTKEDPLKIDKGMLPTIYLFIQNVLVRVMHGGEKK